MSLKILIVEEGAPVATAQWRVALLDEGMITEIAATGAQAITAKLMFQPDVVLIDLGLPDRHGLDMVERFARDGDCGIIVVTATLVEGALVAGLETGADDFVTRPVAAKELAARIRAVHRRLTHPSRAVHERAPKVTLDRAHRSLVGPGPLTTPLTEAEYKALVTLLEADGASVSRDRLGRVALQRSLAADDRSVDQLVLKLRRKLSVHGVIARSILSSRGLGYVIPDPRLFDVSGVEPRAVTTAVPRS